MKSNLLKSLGTLLGLWLAAVSAQAAADSSSTRDSQAGAPVKPADMQRSGESAQKLIGQDVKNTAGEGLGQVQDLVIDGRAGKIVYALVSSGGLLGVGEKIRAVPLAAFKTTSGAEGDFVLPIERTAWDAQPALRESEIDTLLTEARSRSVYEQYGLDWKNETRLSQADKTNAGAQGTSPKLMRVSRLAGKELVNAGQNVGKIEDVIVHLDSRRASIVLDPNDDYTGTDRKFIIDFNQLSASLDNPDKLSTVLTSAEFARATPVREDWWEASGGFPYVWTGAGTTGLGSSLIVAGTERAEQAAADRSGTPGAARPTVAEIRTAVHYDASLAAAARGLVIEERGETLIVTGTAPNTDAKKTVGEQLARIAPGWEIDNQVKVGSVAE